jgi:hypothetical protein
LLRDHLSGNLYPILLYDERDADQVRRVIEAGRQILRACVEMGGSLAGEHGIGAEKINEMPLMFSPDDLLVMSSCGACSIPPSGRIRTRSSRRPAVASRLRRPAARPRSSAGHLSRTSSPLARNPVPP